jgi:outer membrane protein assembly factor BamB
MEFMLKRICFVGFLAAAACAGFADWPQYLGANRDGISKDAVKLAETWPADGPKVLWKLEEKLGTGYGGAVVEGGKVYLLDRVKDQQDVLRCIDLATGAEEWTFAYDAPVEAKENPKAGQYKGAYNGSRNMPAVDGKSVFTLGPFGDLHCVDKKTHQSVWSVNLIRTYETTLGNWGVCQSPLVYKDTVIVAPLSKSAGIVAFDKATGKEAWKSEALGGICWTSPGISNIGGVDQVVMLVNRNDPRLVGLDAASGQKLWMYKGWKCANPIASHTDCGDGKFFITGGYKAGCVMVQVKKDGDAWKAEELFKSKDCGARAVTPIFYKGHIYANSTDAVDGPANGLMCMGLDGKVLWKTSNEKDDENGSVLIADGKILNLVSETGVLRLVNASPDSYKELASAQVTKGINIWAPMAISDGKLLVRNRRTLLCLDVGGAK